MPNYKINSKKHTKKEIVSIYQFSKIAMTFWLGGSWVIALVIFPLLFRVLDTITASQISIQIIHILSYIGLICLTTALAEVMVNHKLDLIKTKRFWYIIAMDFCLILNFFTITPILARLKLHFSQILVPVSNFSFWDSYSLILFYLICLLGVFYLIEM